MRADVLSQAAPSVSSRLLADVRALGGRPVDDGASALMRLEAALGSDLADRLVDALSEHAVIAPDVRRAAS